LKGKHRMELKEEHIVLWTETSNNVKHLMKEQGELKINVKELHGRLDNHLENHAKPQNGSLPWKRVSIIVGIVVALGGSVAGTLALIASLGG